MRKQVGGMPSSVDAAVTANPVAAILAANHSSREAAERVSLWDALEDSEKSTEATLQREREVSRAAAS